MKNLVFKLGEKSEQADVSYALSPLLGNTTHIEWQDIY